MADAPPDPRSTGGRRRPPDVVTLGLAVMTFMATGSMVTLFVPLVALGLGASPSLIGLLVSVAYVFPVFLAMPVGAAVDRVGARRPMLAAAAAMACAPLLPAAYPGFGSLLVLQVVAGLAHLVFVIAAQRYVASLGARQRGERNFGWFSSFQSAGHLAGPLAGGVALDLVGGTSSFAVAGIGCLAATALAATLRERVAVRRSSAPPLRPFGSRGDMTTLARNPGVRIAMVVSCGILVAHATRQSFLPVYLESLAYPATTIGMLVSAFGLASMMVRPAMPLVVRALGGRSATLLVMVLVVAGGLALTTASTGILPLALATFMMGMGAGLTQPLTVVTVSDHVPPASVGFALGFRLTGNRIAQVVSPLAIGLAAEWAGVRWTFAVAAVVLVAAVPFVVAWRGAFERAERGLADAGPAAEGDAARHA